jgi:hypothetical protein
MTRPSIQIINTQTQEEVIREMNDAEYEQYLIDVATAETTKAEADAQAAAKTEAKRQALAALGLSQEVVNLLAE